MDENLINFLNLNENEFFEFNEIKQILYKNSKNIKEFNEKLKEIEQFKENIKFFF